MMIYFYCFKKSISELFFFLRVALKLVNFIELNQFLEPIGTGNEMKSWSHARCQFILIMLIYASVDGNLRWTLGEWDKVDFSQNASNSQAVQRVWQVTKRRWDCSVERYALGFLRRSFFTTALGVKNNNNKEEIARPLREQNLNFFIR